MRGRGGMNKNYGRGALMEQLGVEKGEIPDNIQTEPSTFPPLQFRPNPIKKDRDLAQSYRLVVKKEFREHMQNSDYYISIDTKKSDIERYSDRYQLLGNKKSTLNLHWSRFPKELHPQSSKSPSKGKKRKNKSSFTPNLKKKSKDINVKEKLEELEKKENLQKDENEEEETAEVIEEIEEEDEEMDEGTDYVNSYFDNGEEYLDDDDDGADEGGVY